MLQYLFSLARHADWGTCGSGEKESLTKAPFFKSVADDATESAFMQLLSRENLAQAIALLAVSTDPRVFNVLVTAPARLHSNFCLPGMHC